MYNSSNYNAIFVIVIQSHSMEHKKSNKLIKKANELVESRYKFDIWETRVLAKMITLIHKDDEDFKTYRIYIKELQDDFQLTRNKDAYKRLKDGARRLMSRIVTITYMSPEGEKVLETPVIIGVETLVAGKSFVDVSFHPNMKPFLLQLKSQFLMYDIRNILKISSVHSVRIYELLKQYEKIGTRTFLIEELKDILQVSDKYPLYANFKQRVIKKAQKDLEKHTDITFTYEEKKKGRSIEKITFFIRKNASENAALIEEQAPSPQETDEASHIRAMLVSVGIEDTKTQESILTAHSPAYIQATLKKCETYFKKTKKAVQNKAGYIINALQEGYYKEAIQKEQQKAEKGARRAKKQQKKEQQELHREKRRVDFMQIYTEKIQKLKSTYDEERLLDLVLEEKRGHALHNMVVERHKNNEPSKMLEVWVNDYLAQKYLSPEEYDFDVYLKKLSR